ncbi:MAG: hypothetical protein ABI687_12940, partial [Flavitalea sp.]
MRKLLLSSCMIFCAAFAFSQRFTYKAKVTDPDTSGFYQILISPEAVARSAPDLADIRLTDNDGKQIPYVVKTEIASVTENNIIDFPITAQRREADSLTHVLLNNIGGSEVSELFLTIGNTGATRTVSISGSDDSSSWYIIKENISLEMSYQEKTQFVQTVQLPATNYRFYNIVVNGRNLLPVKILKAGINDQRRKNGAYQALPDPRINMFTRSNTSYGDIFFKDNYQVDQLKLEIAGPRFFKRTIHFFSGDSASAELLESFPVSSQQPVILPLHFKGNRLHFRIDNQDNPPLEIKSIHGFQLNKCIVAYLEAGRHYEFFYGDSTLKAPRYDLTFFADSIGKAIKTLSISEIQNIKQPADQTEYKQKKHSVLLWAAIGIALIILLFATWKMLN